MAKLIIYNVLPNLNDYTKANRANRYAGAQLKKRVENLIFSYIDEQLPDVQFHEPVRLNFIWYEPNQRRDLDNICFAKKFILDALVKAGVLENDNWKHVKGFTDTFYVDKVTPRVEVEIMEIK